MKIYNQLSDLLRELRARFKLWCKPKKDCCYCCVLCKYFDNCKSDLEPDTVDISYNEQVQHIKLTANESKAEKMFPLLCSVVGATDLQTLCHIQQEIAKAACETPCSTEEISEFLYYNAVYFGKTFEESLEQLRYAATAEPKGGTK